MPIIMMGGHRVYPASSTFVILACIYIYIPARPSNPQSISHQISETDAVVAEKEAMGIVGNLSAEQLHSFNSNGFLVLESFSSPEETQELRDRMAELLQQFDDCPSSVFRRQSTDEYLCESVENISFFFEEKAFGDDGCLKQSKELSLSKVSHALHDMDPVFKKYSYSKKIAAVLFSLGYKRPVIFESTYVFKQPGIGGEVLPHQDNSFLYTEPPSCIGLWLALEDATINNGCLWAIPGSHMNGLMRRYIRDEEGVHFDRPSPSYDQKEFVALEVKAGSLVFIHGDLVHKSFENQSSNSRHAFALHVVDTERSVWPKENWIKWKSDPEPVYVLDTAAAVP